MITLDEAIAKYNKLANNDRTCYQEEAYQLAEWLEELKELKSGTVIKSGEYPYFNGFKDGKEVGYNKAIDDAKDVILQTLDNEILVDTLHLRLEQLKAGGKGGK